MDSLTEQQILEAPILVVDDEPANVALVEQILQIAGYTSVQSTTDPREVFRLYETYRPDLILLDLNTPHLSGFEVMERLRAQEEDAYLAILVLTASTDRATRLRALGSGAKDFLTKPLDLIEVRMRVRTLLEARLLYKQLVLSHQESERLLLNVLPQSVAEDLKKNGRYRPVRYQDASILFTDFKGFTLVAADLTPQQLIQDLEVCFTYFDNVARRHGLQRLKTIGDSYMCAGGIPEMNHTHPVDCVLAALEMQDFIEHRKAEMEAAGKNYWRLRAGVHTGPIVAGVIGRERFAYDVWGDTVNLASRMESSGEAGKVNVSEETHERVRKLFECEPRGKIPAKNKGEVDMFFVHRILPEFSVEGLGVQPNEAFFQQYALLTSPNGR